MAGPNRSPPALPTYEKFSGLQLPGLPGKLYPVSRIVDRSPERLEWRISVETPERRVLMEKGSEPEPFPKGLGDQINGRFIVTKQGGD